MSAVELPSHPDPHAWTWTDAEKRAILKWGEGLRASVLEEALKACDDVDEPGWTGYECPNTFPDGVSAAKDAIRALSGPKGQKGGAA